MGINKGSNRYRSNKRSNKRYTKNRYSNKKRNSNKRYTKKRYTKKRYNKKRYTKKRYKNTNKIVKKYLGGNTMFDDINEVITSSPRKRMGCPRGKIKVTFPLHESVNCANKLWANCISDKFNTNEGRELIDNYLLQEGEIDGVNDTSNIDEILRNMKRLLVTGIYKEIDGNKTTPVTIPNIGGDVLDVKSIIPELFSNFLKGNNDNVILKRILSSLDTTKSSAVWDFPTMINNIVLELPVASTGEFGCVVKNMNNILITFCYYYVNLGCDDIVMGAGVKHGRFIVRAYNKYNLNKNEMWNTFKLQILPLNVGNTPMIHDIIVGDKLFRDTVIINMIKDEGLNKVFEKILGISNADYHLIQLIERFSELIESGISEAIVNIILGYYCNTTNISIDYDISLLNKILDNMRETAAEEAERARVAEESSESDEDDLRLMVAIAPDAVETSDYVNINAKNIITNILNNLKNIKDKILDKMNEDPDWKPECMMNMITNAENFNMQDEIKQFRLDNPDGSVYDWLKDSKFSQDTGGERAIFKYNGNDYNLPRRSLAGDWIKQWNVVTGDEMPEDIPKDPSGTEVTPDTEDTLGVVDV